MKVTEEMVEAAARAAYEAKREDLHDTLSWLSFDQLSAIGQERRRNYARAALEAAAAAAEREAAE